jgi:Nuclease-related domain
VRIWGARRQGLTPDGTDGSGGLRWVILIGLLAGTGLAVVRHPLTGLIATVTTALTSGRTTARLGGVRQRPRSERLVSELLTHLPEGYALVNDVVLPAQQGIIDHIVIGPCGVVVIEPRQCTEDHTTVGVGLADGHEPGPGPTRQGSRAALAVRDFLAERHPDLRRSALRFVDSVVVFTDPRSPLEMYQGRSAVVRYSELLQFIRELARQRAMDASTAAALARTLTSISAPRTLPSDKSSAVTLAAPPHGFLST